MTSLVRMSWISFLAVLGNAQLIGHKIRCHVNLYSPDRIIFPVLTAIVALIVASSIVINAGSFAANSNILEDWKLHVDLCATIVPSSFQCR